MIRKGTVQEDINEYIKDLPKICPACETKLVRDDFFPNRLCCPNKKCQFDWVQGK